GQAFELKRGVGDGDTPRLETDAIEAAFHRQHLGAYGHSSPGAAVELVNARLTAYGLVPRPSPGHRRGAGLSLEGALVERRTVWFDGASHDCPIWDRDRLPGRAETPGPAAVGKFRPPTTRP